MDRAELWRTYKSEPSLELRNRLWEEYLYLVKIHALKLWKSLRDFVELDDLISAGSLGLLDAIEAFDPQRGVKFETYSILRIRGAMFDDLRVGLGAALLRARAARINRAVELLQTRLGRQPTHGEVAGELELSDAELDQWQRETTAVGLIGLHEPCFNADEANRQVRLFDLVEDPKAIDPVGLLQRQDLLELLGRDLNERERLVLVLYYFEGLNQREIGNVLGVGESRVSQMRSSILERLLARLSDRWLEFCA